MSKELLSDRMRKWIHLQHPSWGQDSNHARWQYMLLDLALLVEGNITHTPVLNERAMQADLVGRLERRNAELMAAIKEAIGACGVQSPYGWHEVAVAVENVKRILKQALGEEYHALLGRFERFDCGLAHCDTACGVDCWNLSASDCCGVYTSNGDPMTESEWQELSGFLAREILGWRKWDKLTEKERDMVMVVKLKYHNHHLYWWQRDDETYKVPIMLPMPLTVDWQPYKNVSQAMLILKTLLKNIGRYAEAELHIRILPSRCRITIQNWVATEGTPARWIRSPYMENEMQAICLAAKEWCDVQTA